MAPTSAPYPFDPALGWTVRTPEGKGAGYWVGAPGVHQCDGTLYLCYRYRRPRDLGRGHTCRLARSHDGGHSFIDLWSVAKEELGTSSIERCALTETGEGWILYLSYVDPVDNRWCIDAVTGKRPEDLASAVGTRRPVLRAAPLGLEGVKDPVVLRRGNLYWLYVSCAYLDPGARPASSDELHRTQDVYNTGLVASATGLAVSRDGLTYEWLGITLKPNAGHWDGYAARLSCLVDVDGVSIGLYDGSAHVSENYEERTGVVLAEGATHLKRLSVDAPWLTSPHGSGSLRYLAHAGAAGRDLFFYEWATPDGAHELRVSEVTSNGTHA